MQKNNILAEGEATGHAHRAIGKDVVIINNGNNTKVLKAPNGAEIVHEEHSVITLPKNDYDVSIVNEYDPFEEEAKKVVD